MSVFANLNLREIKTSTLQNITKSFGTSEIKFSQQFIHLKGITNFLVCSKLNDCLLNISRAINETFSILTTRLFIIFSNIKLLVTKPNKDDDLKEFQEKFYQIMTSSER